MEFTPTYSTAAFLAFLGIICAVSAAGCATILLLLIRKYDLARRILVATIAGMGVYGVLLVASSFLSAEKVLARGEQKYFCEVDCHLAYSVVDVTLSKTFGTEPEQRTAEGMFYVVTLNVSFDEETISPTRGQGSLRPNYRYIAVIDEEGNIYGFTRMQQEVSQPVESNQLPPRQALRPGESHTTRFVFDVPSDIRNPRLLVTTADPVMRLVIGHENSFFHSKISFALKPQS